MERITELKPNQIFVFGSNALGNHAGGAARQAVECFGAIMGQAEGLQGQSYGIVTLDENMQRVSLARIGEQLAVLSAAARENPDKEYLLTLIGCGIAGFGIPQIKAEVNKIVWPSNVVIPWEFRDIMWIKGFDKNLCCRGMQFEVGGMREVAPTSIDRPMALCTSTVIHFCASLSAVHEFYPCNANNRYCVIEPIDEIVTDGVKFGARAIRVLREITGHELKAMKGLKNGNVGLFNSGDFNSGDFNSGDFNSGNRNSGDRNSGDFNSGDRNSGDFNSGDRNSGDFNSGNRNSGNFNSGYRNSGYRNSGNFNSGYRNSGDFNSGDFNSGDFNSGDCCKGYRNSGVFCTGEKGTILMFDAPCSMTWEDWRAHPAYDAVRRLNLTQWIPLSEMTDEEKRAHPYAEENEGYLKVYTYEEAWANLWHRLTPKERQAITSLPNFDADKFEYITGIRV